MKFFWIALLFLSFNFLYGKHDLAVCAIFQNEAPYLREWIEFHKLVGATHFYLYNNLSTDNYLEILSPYVESGEVELIDWPFESENVTEWAGIQCSAYNHALNLARDVVKWLAILDTDEFLFLVKLYSLLDFLADYESMFIGGVCVNWQMYGTSNVEKIEPGQIMIEKLIYKAPTDYEENLHVKSIVRPERVDNAQVHRCELKPGYVLVKENSIPWDFTKKKVKVSKVRINHYWTRDEDFFYNTKIPRRKKWADGACLIRKNNINQVIDTAIYKYIPALLNALR